MRSRLFFFLFTVGTVFFPVYFAFAASQSGLHNPIGTDTMLLADVIIRLTKFVLGGIAIFAVVTFIYGGFVMITSAGNPEKITKAKDTLVWAIFGLGIALLSYSFLSLVFNVISGATAAP